MKSFLFVLDEGNYGNVVQDFSLPASINTKKAPPQTIELSVPFESVSVVCFPLVFWDVSN
jgi:hypothetical protein